MSDQLHEMFEVFDDVVEMTTDPASVVPLSRELVASVTEKDDEPLFATFVIESGWSKSKRLWGPELFSDVAAEINSSVQGGEPIVGYMGHIRKEDDPYAFPPIQLHWLGAKLIQAGDKAKLAVKGYLLPGTQGRAYAERKPPLFRSVSWRGKIAQEQHGQGVRVKKFLLESIDLARPRAAGMSARLVALTSEMETDERSEAVKNEEIAALSENELRAHNSGLVLSIETAARKPLEDRVSEMTTEAAAVKPTLDLIPEFRKVLGLDENMGTIETVQAVISELRRQGKKLRDSVLDAVLDKKLKGGEDRDRALVRSVIAGEMKDKDVRLTGDEEKDEKTVEEMVNSVIDSNPQLKETVSEMMETPASPPTTQPPRGTPRELKVGMQTERIRVRSASR